MEGAVEGQSLETVRALHQTVVALRAALEESRAQIALLKKEAGLNVINRRCELSHDCDNNEKNKSPSPVPPPLPFKTTIKSDHTITKNTIQTSLLIQTKRLKSNSRISLHTTLNDNVIELSRTVKHAPPPPHPQTMDDNNKQQRPLTDDPQTLLPDEEVDDIELIFTTDDEETTAIKEASDNFQHQLVSIENDDENDAQRLNTSSYLANVSDRSLDDDVFESAVIAATSMDRENSLLSVDDDNSRSFDNRSVSLEKDESFDQFEGRVPRIVMETDISKCGVAEYGSGGVGEYGGARRNTCPNPLQYRPLGHREALSRMGRVRTRPILGHGTGARKQDSGAQTDISALPQPSWVSETNLLTQNRLSDNFATLPSKFPHPASRLRLSEKTVEARRLLLSDIGFTSMVPELSRSADHLTGPCPAPELRMGRFLAPATPITWKVVTPPTSPPLVTSSRRRSAPVSPCRRACWASGGGKSVSSTSKVRFASSTINCSLPELSNWNNLTLDSSGGDSTDSLIEEAEIFLRRSIDCILGSSGPAFKKGPRRASAPEPPGEGAPPPGWQPFLPRAPRDLRPDHWVKVILGEGRVRGGRVRYIGPVIGHGDGEMVGVQLGSPEGVCDGTWGGRRYFQCETYHGIFVPFKKVIMGWRP